MATIFRKLDVDLSTVRFDLNAYPAASTGFGVKGNISLGALDVASNLVGQQYDPAWMQPGVPRTPVFVEFRLIYAHATMDNLLTQAELLLAELDVPGPYVVQLQGQSAPVYFDGFRAELPSILRDEGNLHQFIVNKLTDPLGLLVRIPRLPYLYLAKVTVAAQTVKNDPASGTHPKYVTINVAGTMPTRANVKVAPETGTKLCQLRVARRSYGSLADWRSNYFVQAESGTLTDAATLANDATASGGGNNRVQLLNNNPTVYEKRIRWAITPADPSGVEGTFRVYARLFLTPGFTYQVGLKWSPGNLDPPIFSADPVTLTVPSTVSASAWYMVDLGVVSLEHGLGTTFGLVLELWASSPTGTSLPADYVMLWPQGPTPGVSSDQSITVSTRGWRDALGATAQSWVGTDGVGGATFLPPPSAFLNGDPSPSAAGAYRLNATQEAWGTPPAAGIPVATSGRNVFVVSLSAQRANQVVRWQIGQAWIFDVTAGGTIANTVVPLQFIGGVIQSFTIALEMPFDAIGGHLYQARISYTAPTQTGARITVFGATFGTFRSIGSGTEANVNGDYGFVSGRPASFATASGIYREPLSQEGAFIDLLPGNNDLLFDYGETPPVGMEAVDPREPLAESLITRSCDVTVTYFPRITV